LKWNKSTDAQTQQAALTYNVMIGTSLLGTDILSPVSHKSTGKRFIPAAGNAGTRDYYILNAAALVNGTKYYWKVQAIDNVFAGSFFSSPDSFIAGAAKTASFTDADSVAQSQQAIPQEFALSPNYPNPFNPSTRLNLNLPENGRVVAVVYDLTGQEVVRLHDAEMAAGYKLLDWDGRNAAGTVAGNGVYFVKVIFAGESGARKESTSRVLLLK
jgi:hypothetical protein